MKLSCLQENLSRALAIVGRAVGARSTLPILNNVLITAEDDGLKLSATDLSVAITMVVGAKVDEPGSITVPARLLADFVNTLPAERIDMESTDDPVGLSLKCVNFESNISGSEAADFPPIPEVEEGLEARIDPVVLREATDRVCMAAAVEDSRPVLTGVKVEISGDDFKFAAADGFRLAVLSGKLEEAPAEDLEFLIPARALREVGRLVGRQTESVGFTVSKSTNQAVFHAKGVEVVCSLLGGNFPNYRELIPQMHDTRAVVSRDAFLRATKMASVFSREGTGIIRFNLDGEEDGGGSIKVSARAEEIGDQEGRVVAEMEGKGGFIAFNSKYVTDVLEVLDGELAFEIGSKSQPGVFKPVDGCDYIYVVMPMFVGE